MDDLSLIAEWMRSPITEQDYCRLVKVSNAILNEVGHVVRTVAPAALAPAAMAGGAYMAGQSGVGQYQKTKAMFDPNVIRERMNMYGGSTP